MIYEIKIIIIFFERNYLNLTLYDISDETEFNILFYQHNCPISPLFSTSIVQGNS